MRKGRRLPERGCRQDRKTLGTVHECSKWLWLIRVGTLILGDGDPYRSRPAGTVTLCSGWRAGAGTTRDYPIVQVSFNAISEMRRPAEADEAAPQQLQTIVVTAVLGLIARQSCTSSRFEVLLL